MPSKPVSDSTYAQRLRETNELEVSAAFEAQRIYSRAMHRRGSNDVDRFVKTPTFTNFIKFIRFAREVHLPDHELYIKLMVKAKRSPNTWCSDRSYRIFLQQMNTSTSSLDSIRISIQELQSLADKVEQPVSKVVAEMSIPDLLQMVRQRRLSPWIILNSSAFTRKIFQSNASEQDAVSKVIDPDYWTIIMAQNKRGVNFAKTVCSELEI